MKNVELTDKVNQIITDLVYPKYELQKAYNYYNGKMDAEQYRYLEENYGIGSPTSIEFIPLIKKHIDALVGEYLGVPIIPKISCKDADTISNIEREKQLSIANELAKNLANHLQNSLLQAISGKDITDVLVKDELDKLKEDLDQSFISQYEIAAQNVLEYIMQSRATDIVTKLRQIFLDILISGYCYFRTVRSTNNDNVNVEVLSPLNTFTDRNPNSPYIKDSTKSVVRKWYTKQQILNLYGKDLNKQDLKDLQDAFDNSVFDAGTYYVRNFSNSNGTPKTEGLRAGEELVPGYPTGTYTRGRELLIPVYEVEWLETDSKFVMQRYSSVRIGENIHILKGKDNEVIRSRSNPDQCTLTINGVVFINRGAEPYSLVLACASLQDKYNILHFYRDNLIASSGTTGDWIDISLIPKNLGVEWPDRVKKWLAYKKGGIGLIDTSQEGRLVTGQAPMNTIFNGFDDTVKVQAVQAIQLAIDSIEQSTSSITGVFRERLNGIQAKDAVTNIQVGQNNSFIITKQFYQQMDLVAAELLLDLLNVAKIVFKNGLSGVLILGDKYSKVFTALPEYFTLSDFDVHVVTSTDIIREQEQIKQLLPELIKAGVDPTILVEAFTARSLTELKRKVQEAIKKQKAEANQLSQLQQAYEQAQQQVQQLSKQLQQAQNKVESLNQDKIKLEQEKLNLSNKVEWYKAETDRTYKTKMAEIQDDRTKAELAQLYDGNPYNDQIKQIK